MSAATAKDKPGDRERWVRVERRLGATPERVYRAWSDTEELARWFPQRIEGSLAPGSRSVLVWHDQRTWWDVISTEPSHRFVFRWPWGKGDALVTTVTVDVAPAGMGSRVKIEDGPFPVDQPGGLDAYAEALEGWGETMTLLRAFIDFSIDARERD